MDPGMFEQLLSRRAKRFMRRGILLGLIVIPGPMQAFIDHEASARAADAVRFWDGFVQSEIRGLLPPAVPTHALRVPPRAERSRP
jgi:hypothetical protein